MAKFKVGDRVKVIGCLPGFLNCVDRFGTVTFANQKGKRYNVLLDGEKYRYLFDPKELELVKDIPNG